MEEGRKRIREQGLAGAVSIEHHSLNRLPYADNLVNLIEVEKLADPSTQGHLMEELLRVLRPGGSAYVKESALSKQRLLSNSVDLQIDRITIGSSIWYTFHKLRPDAMDEWTHRRYDPTRNWEVINTGGLSYASYRVAALMEQLVEYQPDLFVI